MFTRIDHVTICVPDLGAGIAQFKKLGFNMFEGGAHPGKGTHNAIAFNENDYVELLSIRDQAEHRASSRSPAARMRRSRNSSRRAAASATSCCKRMILPRR